MSKALPGEHYCFLHQGNHSHYDPRNCTVCRLTRELEEARAMSRALPDLLKQMHDLTKDLSHAIHAITATNGRIAALELVGKMQTLLKDGYIADRAHRSASPDTYWPEVMASTSNTAFIRLERDQEPVKFVRNSVASPDVAKMVEEAKCEATNYGPLHRERVFNAIDRLRDCVNDALGAAATQARAASEMERFKVWASSKDYDVAEHPQCADAFDRDDTDHAWEGWRARAALSAQTPGEGWMPIGSAPKDGTTVYLHQAGKTYEGSWLGIEFHESRDIDGNYLDQTDPDCYWMDHESGDVLEPTEWMPKNLPKPPATPGEA